MKTKHHGQMSESFLTAVFLSLSGGLLAFVVMWALFPLEGKGLSAAGISVAGAAAHNVGQLLAARVVMGTAAVFGYLPFLLLGSVLTGLATGAAFLAMRPALLRTPWMQALQREKTQSLSKKGRKDGVCRAALCGPALPRGTSGEIKACSCRVSA